VTGHKAGETVSYTLPSGKTAAVEIVSVAPYAS
jgi:transcription elongation factor GreA